MNTTKRFLLAAALLALSFASQARAQIGVAALFGTDTQLGAQVSYYHPVHFGQLEGLRIGGDVAVYLPRKVDYGGGFARAELTTTYYELGVNAHYMLLEEEARRLYALAGLSYMRVSVSTGGDIGTFAASTGRAGLNAGAGGELASRFGRLFGEAKLTLGNLGQFVLSAGLRF